MPSKIFEYARLGIPILYFGGGEGEDIIKQYDLGWVAEASNYGNLNAVISKLQTKNRIRIQEVAFENFDFNNQLIELIKHI